MISINNNTMLDHLQVEQTFLNKLVGQPVRFKLIEEIHSTTEYRDGTDFKILPLTSTKITPMEVILEHISYDHVLQEFTINNQYKTRSFQV